MRFFFFFLFLRKFPERLQRKDKQNKYRRFVEEEVCYEVFFLYPTWPIPGVLSIK